MGKPRQDGLSRPLKVSIKDGVPFPRLIDLSTAMKSEASMSTFHVRKFETPEQRKAGFLARQSKRDAARAEVTDQTTTQPNPADTNPHNEAELVEEFRGPELTISPSITSITSDSAQMISSQHHDSSPTSPELPSNDDPVPIDVFSFDYFYEHNVLPKLYPKQLESISRNCEVVRSHCEKFPKMSVEDCYVRFVPDFFRTTFIKKYYELYDYKIVPASRFKNQYL